jgi:hypothetical protein
MHIKSKRDIKVENLKPLRLLSTLNTTQSGWFSDTDLIYGFLGLAPLSGHCHVD